MGSDRHPSRECAVTKHLDLVGGADHSALDHQRRIDRLDTQPGQPFEINHDETFTAVLGLLQAAKSALGHAPFERHLAALVPRRRIAARARALSLVTAPRRFAAAGADSATHSRVTTLGAGSRLERM